MYQPPHFVETDSDVLHALIRAHPLGLLISAGADGPVANPLPFLLDADVGPHGRLRAHLARANPQWRQLADNRRCRCWSSSRAPTATSRRPGTRPSARPARSCRPGTMRSCRCAARARVIEDTGWLAGQIAELTATHEAAAPSLGQVSDAPETFIEAQLKGIVGMEIEIAEIDGQVEGQPEPPG